ncbi:centromere protein P-like [Babylonia areolata]|uniref:centromere protein P-like n=1 Tax=Babylonia areolata TaxID=304850 RepID=UPI003FD04C8B
MFTRQRAAPSDGGDRPAMQDVLDEEMKNKQIINDLENEIQLLEQRLKQFRDDGKQPQDVTSPLPSLESVTKEIHELEQLVKENEILSGVTISETSHSVLEQGTASSLRQHSISGEAGGMQFKLQYDVCEYFDKTQAGKPNAEVTTLDMDVRDDMVALLKPHLYSVATELNVRDLFQLMSSYGRWIEDRERAINHFATTFPELVQRVDANDEAHNISIVMVDPKHDVKFHITWGLRVLAMRSVVPDLQLQVEAYPEVIARDKKGVLESAPEVFQMMLKKFGIESALHMLVKLLDEP